MELIAYSVSEGLFIVRTNIIIFKLVENKKLVLGLTAREERPAVVLGGAALGGRRRGDSVRQHSVQRQVYLRQEEGT